MSFESLSDEHLTNFNSAAAALGSTAIANFAVYPFDVLRTRLIVQTLQPRRRRILRTFKSVLSNEGLSALYRGLLPSICGKENTPVLSNTTVEPDKRHICGVH